MAETNETQRVFCPACGTPNPRTNRFCGSCGHPLPELVATPAPLNVAAPLASSPPAVPSAVVMPPTTAPAPPRVVSPEIAQAFPEFAAKAGTRSAPTAPVVPVGVAPSVAVPPAAPPKPPANVVVPADPLARERERERLITEATRQRIKGMVTEARESLERALAFAEGASPTIVAPLYEQIGDLLLDEERTSEALAAYRKAAEVDPKRASAEKKLATLTLRVASQRPENQLSDTLLHGESVMGLLNSGGLRPHTGKRNAGVAMMMSMLIPGFGQFYNGQMKKGLIVLGVFVVSLLMVTLIPDGAAIFGSVTAMFTLRGARGGTSIPPIAWAVALVGLAVWLYAIVDAPFYAAKTRQDDADLPIRPNIDKSGWEV